MVILLVSLGYFRIYLRLIWKIIFNVHNLWLYYDVSCWLLWRETLIVLLGEYMLCLPTLCTSLLFEDYTFFFRNFCSILWFIKCLELLELELTSHLSLVMEYFFLMVGVRWFVFVRLVLVVLFIYLFYLENMVD